MKNNNDKKNSFNHYFIQVFYKFSPLYKQHNFYVASLG